LLFIKLRKIFFLKLTPSLYRIIFLNTSIIFNIINIYNILTITIQAATALDALV